MDTKYAAGNKPALRGEASFFSTNRTLTELDRIWRERKERKKRGEQRVRRYKAQVRPLATADLPCGSFADWRRCLSHRDWTCGAVKLVEALGIGGAREFTSIVYSGESRRYKHSTLEEFQITTTCPPFTTSPRFI